MLSGHAQPPVEYTQAATTTKTATTTTSKTAAAADAAEATTEAAATTTTGTARAWLGPLGRYKAGSTVATDSMRLAWLSILRSQHQGVATDRYGQRICRTNLMAPIFHQFLDCFQVACKVGCIPLCASRRTSSLRS